MKTQLSYPEVYRSKVIEELLSKKPPIPEAPIAPVKPVLPPDPGEYDSGGNRGYFLFFLIGAIVAFIAIIGSDIDNKGSVIFLLLIIIVLLFFLFKTTTWDKESHEKKRAEYNRIKTNISSLESKYQEEYSSYLVKKAKYDSNVKNIQSLENTLKYRCGIICEWLATREEPTYERFIEEDIVKKGVSEKYFFDLLSSNFDEVYADACIPVGEKYYYPDILLVVGSLYIDIEIDEPYAGNDGTPIHYYTSNYGLSISVDHERNDYFTECGFEVIRFSEEQVFLHSDDCIDFIKKFVKNIMSTNGDLTCNPNFVLTKWTKEQASRLAYQRFRNTYVPSHLQSSINRENQRSYYEIRSEI